MILIRFNPFVYLDYITSNTIFLYNMLDYTYKYFHVEGIVHKYNKDALCLKNTLQNMNIANMISKYQMGFVDIIDIVPQNILSDSRTELLDEYSYYFSHSLGIDGTNSLIKRLFISFSSDLDVITGCKNGCESEIIGKELENIISFVHKKLSLDYIYIYTNKDGFITKHDYIYELMEISVVFICIPLSDFLMIANNIMMNSKMQIVILIDNVSEITDDHIARLKTLSMITSVIVYINSYGDLSTINRWELTHELQIRISPFAKIDEIRALFGYDKENILKNKQTMGDIIRNEWVNINYFGDMFINAQGEVLIATGRSIGKLSTKEVKMDMYFSKNSLWRATRKQFSKCQMCIFRNICPPLTEIEIMFNVTFCNIINYE